MEPAGPFRRAELGHSRTPLAWALFAMFVWLAVVALVHPPSIDESQYVAATKLVSGGLLPYRDFAYLQTPLQPLLFAPLAFISGGHLYLLSRVVNAALGAATLLFVYAGGLKLGVKRSAALAATLMLLSSYAFTWSAGVARNDMLPAALFALAIWLLLATDDRWRLLAGGAALGLAASAKISYAVPAAAIICVGYWPFAKQGWRSFGWVALGAVIGSLPSFVLAAFAPRAFLFDVLWFPAKAPLLYYADSGQPGKLGWHRFVTLLIAAAAGPALLAMVETVRAPLKSWMPERDGRLLLAAAAGGLVSALLNRPFHVPYLLPALPPLFILLGQLLSEREPGRAMRLAWAALMVVGLAPSVAWLGRAVVHRDAPGLNVEMLSAEVGTILTRDGINGPVASVEDEYVVDSGHPLDRRFAAGPFVFRTPEILSGDEAEQWHVATSSDRRELAQQPPAAFVTGRIPQDRLHVEARLASIAAALGFRPIATVGGLTVWQKVASRR